MAEKKFIHLFKRLLDEFDDENPSASLDNLFLIYEKISNLKDEYWKQVKLKEVTELIRSCAGIWVEAISENEFVSVGDTLKVKSMIVNRSDIDLSISNVGIRNLSESKIGSNKLVKGEPNTFNFSFLIPQNTPISQPYWLQNDHPVGMFNITDPNLTGLPEENQKLVCDFTINYNNVPINFAVPVFYRITDPVDGEVYKPVVITPPVTVNIEKDIYFFSSDMDKEIKISVQSFKNSVSGKIILDSKDGWKVATERNRFSV